MDPLISCLMVTRGGLYPAYFAIECFRAQTYDSRELVIVCDEPDAPVASYIAELADPKIRYVETGHARLGDLRNVSVAEAKGELVCQWDDDDLYHPNRLEYQLGNLLKSGTSAHFLGRWTIWWPKRRTLALSSIRVWEGSMLARREAVGTYPAQSREEDAVMLAELMDKHRFVVTDSPDYYCYVVHGDNTCDEDHFEFMLERASWVFSDYEAELAKRAGRFPFRDYLARLDRKAKGEPEVAADFSGRMFGAQRLTIDGARFRGCRFNGTLLTYNGGEPPLFDGCNFHNIAFDFQGPAGHSLALLRWLTDRGIIPEMRKSGSD